MVDVVNVANKAADKVSFRAVWLIVAILKNNVVDRVDSGQ